MVGGSGMAAGGTAEGAGGTAEGDGGTAEGDGGTAEGDGGAAELDDWSELEQLWSEAGDAGTGAGPAAAATPDGPLFPALAISPAGRALLTSGVIFLTAGVVLRSWTLALWGELLLAALLLARLQAAQLHQALKEGSVRIGLHLPPPRHRPPLRVGQPVQLVLVLDNRLGHARPFDLELSCSPDLVLPSDAAAVLQLLLRPGRSQGQYGLVPRRMGCSVVQGAWLRTACGAGLFHASVYWPLELRLMLLESRSAPRAPRAARAPDALLDRTGAHRLRQAGLGSEFKELRQHRPGDPFRIIEWKASARHRRLLVRELQSEVVRTLTVLLDISPSMRQGPPGQSLLDRSVSLVLGLARSAQAAQDRLGLVTFDHRIYGEIRPDTGRAQLRRIATHLGQLFEVVDHDMTSIPHGELVPYVAGQLHSRLGLGTGTGKAELTWEGPPPPALLAAAEEALQRLGPPRRTWLEQPSPSPSPGEARLRLLCQAMSIPLPYRPREATQEGAQGLSVALQRVTATAHAGHTVLVVSDLQGEKGDEVLRRAIRLTRSRCLKLLVLHGQQGRLHPDPAAAGRDGLLHELLLADSRRRTRMADLLHKLKVPVLAWEPDETGESLYRRL
ncbi:MAG: DUF58 domain-containing protein [Deltaproteobacteria bacterium]|nr:DUF58 domain-containing protein [Deltaproteobacteria bacterium]